MESILAQTRQWTLRVKSVQCSETGSGIALRHPIFLGLFGAFFLFSCCNNIQRTWCNNFIFSFLLKVTSLIYLLTTGSFIVRVWLVIQSAMPQSLSENNKTNNKTNRNKVKPGALGWKDEWVYGVKSKESFSLSVWGAPSSASQRTSSCCDQRDQSLNCLHWTFHSYQTPSWRRWWTSPGFDTWNEIKTDGESFMYDNDSIMVSYSSRQSITIGSKNNNNNKKKLKVKWQELTGCSQASHVWWRSPSVSWWPSCIPGPISGWRVLGRAMHPDVVPTQQAAPCWMQM